MPVTIIGAKKIWPVGKIFPRPGRLTIIYHPPIPVERAPAGTSRLMLKEQARSLARRTRDIVASELDPDSLPESESGAAVSLSYLYARRSPSCIGRRFYLAELLCAFPLRKSLSKACAALLLACARLNQAPTLSSLLCSPMCA